MSYIGYTSQTIEIRWKWHVRDVARGLEGCFHAAIRELGEHDWQHEVICDGITTLKDAKYLERHYIEMLGTWGNGYNMTRGGNGSGVKGPLSRAKMRAAKLGKTLSIQHRQNIGKAGLGRPSGMRGKHHSEEARQKTSIALVGRKKQPFTDEHRANISLSRQGMIPWNKINSDADLERIRAINESTVDRLHADIVCMVNSNLPFSQIVKMSGKCYRTVRTAIFRAFERGLIDAVPNGFYKRGPYKVFK